MSRRTTPPSRRKDCCKFGLAGCYCLTGEKWPHKIIYGTAKYFAWMKATRKSA